MAGLNRSIVAGRLVEDPTIRYTKNETAVAHFRLALTQRDGADSIRCVAWGGLAKIVGEYLCKGRLVAVEGRLRIKSMPIGKGSARRSVTELAVENMQVLDSKFHRRFNDAHGEPNDESA